MSMRPAPRRLGLGVGVAICVVLGLGAIVSAHPTAASFVVIRASGPESVSVMVTTDATSLLMKLEALGGRPGGRGDETPAEVDRRIRDLGPVLLAEIDLRFDESRASLVIERLTRSASRPEQIEITLTSPVPSGTTDLRWRTSLFFGAYPLAVRRGAENANEEQYEWLAGPQVSQPYSLASLTASERVRSERVWTRGSRLIAIGFTHIVPGGLDHVLFVLGLFLLAADGRTLLLQISAFTVAHSLTLGLAVAGWVSVPGAIVEPLIAMSIAYVAIENLFATSISRWRLGVVFAFGLLHGLGFAEALSALGLSRTHLATTLIGFNIGVELGQLAVVVAAALVVRSVRLTPEAYRRVLVRPASALIAAAGIFWAVERVF